jgi:hypothetical protein
LTLTGQQKLRCNVQARYPKACSFILIGYSQGKIKLFIPLSSSIFLPRNFTKQEPFPSRHSATKSDRRLQKWAWQNEETSKQKRRGRTNGRSDEVSRAHVHSRRTAAPRDPATAFPASAPPPPVHAARKRGKPPRT